MKQTFAGFVKGLARSKVTAAKALDLYAGSRKDSKSDVRVRIDADLHKGKVSAERHARLMEFLEAVFAEYMAGGKIVDVRDQKDWNVIGEGCHMRQRHGDPANVEADKSEVCK